MNMMTAHEKLIHILKQANYRQLDSGVCAGVANFTMSSFFTNKLVELILFSQVINEIDLQTFDFERFVEEHRPFLESITVYQDITLHPELAGQKGGNEPCGVDMLISEPLKEMGGLRPLLSYSPLGREAISLHLLVQKRMLSLLGIDRTGIYVVIHQAGNEKMHSIFIGYDKSIDIWTLSDANQLPILLVNKIDHVLDFIEKAISNLRIDFQDASFDFFTYLPALYMEKAAVSLCREPNRDKINLLLLLLLDQDVDPLFFNKLFSEIFYSRNQEMLYFLLSRKEVKMNDEQFDCFFNFVVQSNDDFLLNEVIFRYYRDRFTEEKIVEEYVKASQQGLIKIADQFLMLMMKEKIGPISLILSDLYSNQLPIDDRLIKLIICTVESGYEQELKQFFSDNVDRLNYWCDDRGYSFLMCILEKSDNLNSAGFLLMLGVGVDYHYRGMTDLHLAIQQKDMLLVEKLLACGADLAKVSEDGLQAIDFAVSLTDCLEKDKIVSTIAREMLSGYMHTQYREEVLSLCEAFHFCGCIVFNAFPDLNYVLIKILTEYPQFNLNRIFTEVVENERQKFYRAVTPLSFFPMISDGDRDIEMDCLPEKR